MLGVRLNEELEQMLGSVARQQGRSKSDVARHAIQTYVEKHDRAFMDEARRQSLRAAARGWTEEDSFWESIAAWDDQEKRTPPGQGPAAE